MTKQQQAAEEYLLKIRNKEKKIKGKKLELEALYYKAGGCTAIDYAKDHVQTTPENYLEMALIDIQELKAEIEEDEALIESAKGTAYAIVRLMDEPEQRAMIEWFYLNCVSMNEVSQKMHMSERNAYYLKDDALESFGIIMNK